MEINEQLQPIVESIITGIRVNLEEEVKTKITEEVIRTIGQSELDKIITHKIDSVVETKMTDFNVVEISEQKVNDLVAKTVKTVSEKVLAVADDLIVREIQTQLTKMDVKTVVNEIVKSKLDTTINLKTFPEQSIPAKSINWQDYTISGDLINGGIINSFGSVGIEDRATFVQLTLMDHASAFEGPVYAPEVKVRGLLEVQGDLIVKGTVPKDTPMFQDLVEESSKKTLADINDELFRNYSHIVYDEIKERGIELKRVLNDGKQAIDGKQLGYHITDSNLQRLGIVSDLQTQGESYLSTTLYVSGKRVGVNTIEPSTTFTLWDEEVEMVMTKRQTDVGYFGTHRRQNVVLGSANNSNITLTVDGEAIIPKIRIGKVSMTSAETAPRTAGNIGEIVYNENPAPGQYIGWVCLGGTRWAGFGRIE